ncbi:methyl-accepting chemotaxis protein [Anaerobranca gottschalkii]|uniref:Methyl-accepting chemotaxis sensory transducer with Cache sensor n=1 Tax=Anaerobranca gottschalkii DSM 13577 TaxID=1120990 RepID=A0A1I0BJR6_9FIRM|nr:methyl-accepting chemotaxis protein [Anaerobranca gottschalkii]SET07188.1 methyl-accepting chemotaxis sensory transducer with Cache sensor [Anaerobranca gottschalkii DSM 13577]
MNSIKTKIIASSTILLILSFIILGYFTIKSSQNALVEEVEKSLVALVDEAAKLVESRIETSQQILLTIAEIEEVKTMDWDTQLPVLQHYVEVTEFLTLVIVHPDGTAYYSDGAVANLGHRDYVQRAFRGETSVSDVLLDTVTGEPVIAFAAPIKRDGEVVGALVARGDGLTLRNITQDITYGQTGYAYVVNDVGTVVAHNDINRVLNQWNPIEDAKNNKELQSVAGIVQRIINEKSGIGYYNFNGRYIYNAFTPVKGTNWFISVAVDRNEALAAVPTLQMTIIITGLVILVFGIAVNYFLGNTLAKPIISAVEYAKVLANLDLTNEVPEKYLKQKDEIGMLANAIQTMQKVFKETIGNIKEKSNEVTANSESLAAVSEEMTSSSQELASTMQQVAEGATNQAQDLEDIVKSLGELTDNIEQVYGELDKVKRETENTSDKANVGKREMDVLIKSIEDIKNAFELVVAKVERLTNSVKEITGITELISNISEQTNLLALNAAIEAARAGEHGRGFAVVSEEVRKLAEESKQSTEKIVTLVNSITKDTDEVITTSKEVEKSVKEQASSVENTVKAFGDILESVENIAPLMENTYRAMEEILKSKDVVMEKAEQVSAVTEESSAATEEVAASSEELSASSQEVAATAQNLSQIAADLMEKVNRFKV